MISSLRFWDCIKWRDHTFLFKRCFRSWCLHPRNGVVILGAMSTTPVLSRKPAGWALDFTSAMKLAPLISKKHIQNKGQFTICSLSDTQLTRKEYAKETVQKPWQSISREIEGVGVPWHPRLFETCFSFQFTADLTMAKIINNLSWQFPLDKCQTDCGSRWKLDVFFLGRRSLLPDTTDLTWDL